MKKNILFVFIAILNITSLYCDPNEQVKPILEEGLYLYRLEKASWKGTDIFLNEYKNKGFIGSYISYPDGSNTKCVYFSNSLEPEVIGSVEFDSTFSIENAILSLDSRKLTQYEFDLYKILKLTIQEASTDTLVKRYNNTSLNFIPVIKGDERKVYIVTGSSSNEYIFLGNDYLFTFDKNNELKSKKRLHSELIPINYKLKPQEELKGNESFHMHDSETGDLITATDICTILLYKDYTNWKTHNVFSEKYLNILSLDKLSVYVMPMETLNKIYQNEEE